MVFLRSKGLFAEALARADSLGTARDRHAYKHGIYADMGSFGSAYGELSSLMSQWQLRQNLDEMRAKNNQALAARRAFQKAMEAKESENNYKIKILQNRTTNKLTGYEEIRKSMV